MEERIAKRFNLTNPGIGMAPFLIFAILSDLMAVSSAACIAVLSSFLIYVLYSFVLKQNFVHITLVLSLVVIALEFVVKSISGYDLPERDNIFIEFFMLMPVALILYKRKYVTKQILKRTSMKDPVNVRRSVTELFTYFNLFAISIVAYICVYVLMLFFYSYLSGEIVSFITFELRYATIAMTMIVGQLRVLMLNYEFRRELWLPIIDEKSVVTGHIARSVSYSMPEKHLHPAVRILIFYNGMVFLNLSRDARLNRTGYDTPLADDLCSSETYDDCKDRLFRRTGLQAGERPNYITRYNFNNGLKRRIFCLYSFNIKDEKVLKHPFFKKGKFWSEKEIDSNRGKNVFCEIFEKEIDLLKVSLFALHR